MQAIFSHILVDMKISNGVKYLIKIVEVDIVTCNTIITNQEIDIIHIYRLTLEYFKGAFLFPAKSVARNYECFKIIVIML